MDYKDYYGTLGVSRDASQDEIQKAYRKLARQYHPDINQDAGAESRFKDIGEAYEVLKDPDKRGRYDRFGSQWKNAREGGAPPPGFEGYDFGGQGFQFDLGGDSGFSSFFEMLFGSGAAGGSGWRPEQRPTGRGADQEARIRLGLEEAANGGQRQIVLEDPGGGGRRTLRVKIPAGVRDGGRIRLAGQGLARPDASRGDLYLKVELEPHPNFRLEGSDLHTTLDVSPWEAALGLPVTVRTLDGELRVRVPAGSSSGRRIRLRGKGFPGSGEERGDLYAELRIVLPKKVSEKERELYEALQEESTFQPRKHP